MDFRLSTLKLSFDFILSEFIPNYDEYLVFTTRIDVSIEYEKLILYEDFFLAFPHSYPGNDSKTISKLWSVSIISVDSVQKIDHFIFYFVQEIETSCNSFVEELVLHIIHILGNLRTKCNIDKIGNGDMSIAKEIVIILNLRFYSSFAILISPFPILSILHLVLKLQIGRASCRERV